MAEDDNLKFAIVGHIDHGKSTLIGRLLFDTKSLPEGKIEEIKSICESLGKPLEFGYIMDNLEEERDQNITIDTAQIFFRTPNREYTIIDAPGHVEFVKNMITGASQAEAAILIVDAEDGVKEQTRRHAYILSMLGLRQVVVVINKMDSVGYSKERFYEVNSELKEFLSKIEINPMFVIPISAKEGCNVASKSERMGWYDGVTVLQALDKLNPRNPKDALPMRFSVQDVYMWGKRISVGRVESGKLKKGQDIVVLPSGEKTKVESIEEFGKENILESEPGKTPGIVVKDKLFIERGCIISESENLPAIKNMFRAHLFWMSKDSLKKGERIILKCSTQEVICEISEFSRIIDSSTLEQKQELEELKEREVADVLIKTEKPIVIENFNRIEELGRFVIERLNTCGGGIITDV